MSEAPKEVGEIQKMTPQQEYRVALGKYTQLTRSMRTLEKHQRHDQVLERDQTRHRLHVSEITPLAQQLGKNEDAVRNDMLLSEGNLEELGVRGLPVIQLPMVQALFDATDMRSPQAINANKLVPVVNENDIAGGQSISNPNNPEQVIASLSVPKRVDIGYALRKDEAIEPKITGDQAEIDKWSKEPYYAFIFASSRWSNKLHDSDKSYLR